MVARARGSAFVATLVTLLAGAVTLPSASASVGSGGRYVFVPVVPCRLADSRAISQVGPRGTPLQAGETSPVTVRGANGNCTIPNDAVALAMNVTVVDGTAGSFLTIWPADAARPTTANLTWTAGAPPTPNTVDVGLSADGRLDLYNLAGTVDVVVDVFGYYADHDFDDRYYTKAEIDAALAGKAPRENGRVVIGPNELHPDVESNWAQSYGSAITIGGAALSACAWSPVDLPHGARVTRVSGSVLAVSAQASVELDRKPAGASSTVMATVSSSTQGNSVLQTTAISDPVVDRGAASYMVKVCGTRSSVLGILSFGDVIVDDVAP